MKAVLLVDSEEEDAFLIQRAFKKANVANPVRWIASLPKQEEAADAVLVLLDITIKGGLVWLGEFRKRSPRVPLLAITDIINDPELARAMDAGANGTLVKPITFGDLLERIQKVSLDWLLVEQPQTA